MSSVRELLKLRDFRLLWGSELVSVLGDQFTLLALPWLVLQLTGSPLKMGIVLAAIGFPRAVFMLLGGAVTDRYSPRTLILVTNLARFALVAILGLLVVAGLGQMWIIVVFALLFGLADAFFYPAMSAILPQLVTTDQLEPANAVIQGSAHLSAFIGPALAGVVIAIFSHDGAAHNSNDLMGVGLALLIDALTFLTSVILIRKVRIFQEQPRSSAAISAVVTEIADGIRFVWNEVSRRTVFLGLIAITWLITSPLAIGLPVLAHQRLVQGAAGLGAISAAYGLGAVCGNLTAAGLGRPASAFFGPLIFALLGVSGACVAALSAAYDVYSASALLFVVGAVDGYILIQLLSWFQRTTPPALMGRVMSLMMFAIVGLVPVTQIVFGALIEYGLDRVLMASGATLVAICTVLVFTRGIRRMGYLASAQLAAEVEVRQT